MKKFFKVKTVDEVLSIINSFDPLEAEEVPLTQARARVLADAVAAQEDLPQFDRSTMDGYAVRARDTFGATEALPALFTIIGEIFMGRQPDFKIGPGEAARIWTGGMMPRGSDAVIMIEYARLVDETTVELARAAAPYDNVIRAGEDVKKSELLLPRGRRLRPQDVGLLAALGFESVPVIRPPCVAIISTGDEIVPVKTQPGAGQVRDINTYSLGAQVEASYARPLYLGLIKDDLDRIRRAVRQGLEEADTIILSGGSSVGVRDFTVEAFTSFSGSEILVHGVSVSPGKPTILARIGNQSLWGLPGHAVSAMITFDLFLKPLLARLSGEEENQQSLGQTVMATLSRNVASVHGREDYVRARLETDSEGRKIAYPVLGKSGLISTMVKADGLIRIGMNVEGLDKGSEVEVRLFET
ncbi:MAG: molybdopterin molybdotransferase MoeA [Deltaproteobacteria bacterium]|nr:molybdopterin molybdotransferase MoeA [Deltaproteobacteria bacterium]MBW2085423.1 molybdopterin molybdotransferase MoeA [Deltaproteobacteria bacterium]